MRHASRLGAIACSLFIVLMTAAFALAGPASSPTDLSTAPPAPDFSKPDGWLTLPEKPDKAVDVFWIYPTVLYDDVHWLMDTKDEGLRKAALRTITTQAGIFKDIANIYAPMHRQVNIASLALPDEQMMPMFAIGQEDIEKALDYYLEHYNNGRPFILAGHSQGSYRLVELAKKILGKSPAHKRMVAAYAIGWSILPEDIKANPAITMCESAGQTGCFIAYNSVAPGMQGKAPTITPGTFVTNPLNWTIGNALAPASENLGTVFFGDDCAQTEHPHFASAQVKDSGLVVIPADKADLELLKTSSKSFPNGVYHVYDYSLFFENLKQNAAQRVQAFMNQ